MNLRSLLLILLLGCFIMPLNAGQIDPSIKPAPLYPLRWLTQKEVDALAAMVPPFPTDDTADMKILLDRQKNRSADQIKFANDVALLTIDFLASPLKITHFATRYPKTYAFLTDVDHLATTINSTAKNKYNRVRCYVVYADKIKPLFKLETPSYPGGHTARSYLVCTILGELFPQFQSELMAGAEKISQSRVDAGVHYPSDNAASVKLTPSIVQALHQNADFQKDFQEAKEEISSKEPKN